MLLSAARLTPECWRHSMAPALGADQAPVPPPSHYRRTATALHLDALTLVTRLHLLVLCRLAVRLAHQQCPPPLPAGPGGAPPVYSEEPLFLLAPLRPAVGSRQRPAPAVPALAGERPRCAPRPPAAGDGRSSVRPAAAGGAAGCWLLGPQADCLDPHQAGCYGRDSLEPQTAEASGWPAADLDC